MKKSISLILVFALVMGVFAIVPLTPTANATSVDGLKFELNDDGESYCVSGYTESVSVELVIPDTYNSLPVTSIGDKAFFECISLTSVILPDSITTIGDYAFNDCVSLISVTMGDGVTSIGEGAFYNCTVLTDIVIPDSVTSIGESVFYNCYDLSNVTIGNGVTSISNFMFAECMSLTSITIPDSVTSIGGAAFYECIKLTNITIPDKVTSIGEATFYYCRDLVSVTIPDSVTEIHETAFAECSKELVFIVDNNDYVMEYAEKNNFNYILNSNNKETLVFELNNDGQSYSVVGNNITTETELVIPATYNGLPVTDIGCDAFETCDFITSLTIPDSVIKIGDRAFYFCSSLTSVTLGNNIENIGDEAFYGCVKLPCITIPRSTNQIGYNAFINCHSLELINVSENNEIYASVDGVLYNKEKTMLIKYPQGKTLTQYVVPDTVTEIYDFAFQANESLISVVLPDSLITIGESAFNWCSSLVSIIIPNSVASIESAAFCACKSLESVVLSNGLTNIEDSVFLGCVSLLSIEIPNSITNISDHAFDACGSLESVTIGSGVISIEESAFGSCGSLESVTIGSGVISIEESAFGSCEKLSTIEVDENNLSYSSEDGILFNKEKTLIVQYPQGKIETAFTIPDSVNSIGGHAFSGCDSLTNITIPDSVISIGENAFVGCSSLTSVNIPCSVTSIGDYAFSNCASLTSITIPDSVTNIGNSAFYDTAYYNDCLNWENDVLYIGNHLIKAKETLSGDYIIKSGIKYIAPHTFYNCTLLTSIKIPDSVTTIGASAFEDCTALTSVTIPNSVTSIGNYAFSGCDSLAIATIGNSVTSIGDNAFVDYGESFEYIFYLGSREDWNNISIGVDNSGLSFATIHYNSTGHSHSCSIESAPTEQENGKAIDTCPVCGFVNGEEDIVYINNYITAVDTKNAVVDATSNTLLLDMSACQDITEAIVEMDGYTLTTTPTSSYGFIGTGSKLQVADSTGTQVAEYTLVVRGDVNGDSVCDSIDLMLIELARHESNNVTLEGAYFAAANLAEDSEINIDDFNAVVNKAVALA